MSGCRSQYIHTLHQRYGSIVRLTPDEVSVSDVQSFKEIHRIGGGFVKSPWYLNMSTGGPGSALGLFQIPDPKQHAARRKMFARGFSQAHLRSQWEGVVQERVRLAVARIKQECATSGSVDVLKWWMYLAADVSAELMFGESFHMLESDEVCTKSS